MGHVWVFVVTTLVILLALFADSYVGLSQISNGGSATS
jgi:hypothetical protein